MDWRCALVGGLMGVFVGCAPVTLSDVPSSARAGDPDSRVFAGLIVSLRPASSVMVVSKDEGSGRDVYPNFIYVKYDDATRFLLDDQPATLTDIEQYMRVKVDGHMRDGQMFAEIANFSSTPTSKANER